MSFLTTMCHHLYHFDKKIIHSRDKFMCYLTSATLAVGLSGEPETLGASQAAEATGISITITSIPLMDPSTRCTKSHRITCRLATNYLDSLNV